jgi:hypothetical protein
MIRRRFDPTNWALDRQVNRARNDREIEGQKCNAALGILRRLNSLGRGRPRLGHCKNRALRSTATAGPRWPREMLRNAFSLPQLSLSRAAGAQHLTSNSRAWPESRCPVVCPSENMLREIRRTRAKLLKWFSCLKNDLRVSTRAARLFRAAHALCFFRTEFRNHQPYRGA